MFLSSEGRAFSLAPIKIQIHSVRNLSTSLSKDVSRLSNLENEVTSLNHQLDWRIKERGNLHQRLDRSCRSLKELEARVRALENMIDQSMNRYEKAEASLVKEANQIGKIDKVYENEMVKYTNTRKGTSTSSMLETTVSTGADFIPFVGNAKSLVEAITGKDVVTRETLSTTSRIIAVTGIVGGGAVKGIAKGAVKLFSKIGGGAVKKGFKINKNTKFKEYKTNVEKGGSIDTKGTGKPEKPKKHQAEKKSNSQAGNGPYSRLKDSKHVGPGKNFTAAQKQKMIEENMKQNGGLVKSDQTGQMLTKPQKSKKGVTPDPNEWQIDHIIPRDKGGTNSYSNAQVLSRKENREKSNKLPSELDKPSRIPLPTKPKRRKK